MIGARTPPTAPPQIKMPTKRVKKTNASCECAATLETVRFQRRRLEEIIWRRAFDHLHTFNLTKFDCIYSEMVTRIYDAINMNMFHGLGAPSVPPDARLHSYTCHRVPVECAAIFKQKAMRLTVYFYSYAAAVRMLFLKHVALVQAVSDCCGYPVEELQFPPIDFSAFVFRYVNTMFFNGLLRCRNINVPAAIVSHVENKAYVPSASLFQAWVHRGGWERALACNSVDVPQRALFVPRIEMPRVDPPPVEERVEKPPVEERVEERVEKPEDVQVLFLDEV